MLTRKLIVSEYTAALQYWNKKGTTKDETVGVKKAFKTTMIEGQYWITVELQVL